MKAGLKGKIPYRYRAIAYGFAMNSSLAEVNTRLREHGENELYARNLTEATLIYAFSQHLSYGDWEQLYENLCPLMEENSVSGFSFDRSITWRQLQNYVAESGAMSDTAGQTQRVSQAITFQLGKKLASLEGGVEHLRLFITENMLRFSESRERTRYYFCKYLCLYLDQLVGDAVRRMLAGACRADIQL